MHIVFYFTAHRSFVFYSNALSGFYISVLRWVCHTVLKVFWCLVCCVIVHEKKLYFILPHAAIMAFILQPYYQLRLSLCHTTHILLTFNLPHKYPKRISFCHTIPFRLLLCHTPMMSTFIFKHRHQKTLLFYHAL